MTDKLLSFIGLGARAGKLVYGSEAGSRAVRCGKAYLVIVACDASENTKKLMRDKCVSNNVKLYQYSTIGELGNSVGKGRVSVISVRDKDFADSIIKKMGAN